VQAADFGKKDSKFMTQIKNWAALQYVGLVFPPARNML